MIVEKTNTPSFYDANLTLWLLLPIKLTQALMLNFIRYGSIWISGGVRSTNI